MEVPNTVESKAERTHQVLKLDGGDVYEGEWIDGKVQRIQLGYSNCLINSKAMNARTCTALSHLVSSFCSEFSRMWSKMAAGWRGKTQVGRWQRI